ncbi:hypothetical protein [Massilia sp. DWR3-1-1]|uniref:hypothetical protein n=1 Tax=Massilia sp. DWR3-1-1 TaxID=2804559 RepID=UPI003CEE554C
MVHLHLSPSVSQVRSYDEPDGYARRLPYRAIVTITHLTDKLAYLHSAVGALGREEFPALLAMLKERGVTTVMYERHGRMKTRNL